MRSIAAILVWVFVCLGTAACTAQRRGNPDNQAPVIWHDPSPHSVHFVNVDKDVKLEVLDWGGTGQPVVLLAGLGNTAHVYDDFAKLASRYHVYGISRRGFGASSAPVPDEENYSADRLGDDVLAVLEALKIERPVLVGHSIAGEELSSVGSRHPERVSGLVYLDAAYCYAYYDRSLGCLAIDVTELQRKLTKLVKPNPNGDFQVAQELLQKELPILKRDLGAVPKLRLPPPPDPSPADLASFQANRAWFVRTLGLPIPESELRATHEVTPDGRPAGPRGSPRIPQAILSGEQKYTQIRVPVLAICAFPHGFPPFIKSDPDGQAAVKMFDAVKSGPEQKAFQSGVPSAHVVRIPHADHYVFISNEAEVLREMAAFINGLPLGEVDATERKRVIDGAVANLKEYYVYPDVAQKMADALLAHEKSGDDDAETEADGFAHLLTKQLREVSHDRHLSLSYSRDPAPASTSGPSPEDLTRFRQDMERTNCTFEKVEVLPGNIGYLKFNAFPEPSVCREKAVAAMNRLQGAAGIIFDLRDNHGGSPDMVALMASYLFDRPTHLNDIYDRPQNSTQQFWTQSPVPGNKLADKPAYVLTSASTFSGAEEFCYDLKMLKRATLVGETTGGGAHLTRPRYIDDHFTIFVPSGRPINPVSKTGWEGTGVQPDVRVSASGALETAEKLAKTHLHKG